MQHPDLTKVGSIIEILGRGRKATRGSCHEKRWTTWAGEMNFEDKLAEQKSLKWDSNRQ